MKFRRDKVSARPEGLLILQNKFTCDLNSLLVFSFIQSSCLISKLTSTVCIRGNCTAEEHQQESNAVLLLKSGSTKNFKSEATNPQYSQNRLPVASMTNYQRLHSGCS